MYDDKKVSNVVKDLRGIVLNNTAFPDQRQFTDDKLGRAVARFERLNAPRRNRRITIQSVRRFIREHGVFGLVEDHFHSIGRSGARLIILEGPDASGKTALSKKIGEMTGGIGIQNQSSELFKTMFGLPKPYKTAVVDYNRNANVGFLFYVVDNLIGLHKAAKHAAAGKKTIILDSSYFRTFASRVARPTDAGRGLRRDSALYSLINREYLRRYIDTLPCSNESFLVVFMYLSEKARLEQARERSDADNYDTNSAYSRLVTRLMIREERVVKESGVNAISMMTATKMEGRAGNTDFFFVKSKDFEGDLEKKAKTILENV